MNNIIVGMGEALWDVLPEGKKIGGAPANFAYHVSQFGFDSRVVSAVGNDELGDEIMKVFKEKQLKTQIERVDYPTGTVQVTLDDEGVPCYEIKEGVAWDNTPEKCPQCGVPGSKFTEQKGRIYRHRPRREFERRQGDPADGRPRGNIDVPQSGLPDWRNRSDS